MTSFYYRIKTGGHGLLHGWRGEERRGEERREEERRGEERRIITGTIDSEGGAPPSRWC